MKSWPKIVVAPTLAAFALLCGCSGPYHLDERWTAMGQEVHADIYMGTERDARAAMQDIRNAVTQVDATMNFRNPDSELTRLNREAEDAYYAVQDPDLYRVLLLAFDYAKVTEGAFDPTSGPLLRLYERGEGRLPSAAEIDLALQRVGWSLVTTAPEAKAFHFRRPRMEVSLGDLPGAFALDAGARTFSRIGAVGGLLELGSNIYVWGAPPDRPTWTVDLRDPRAPQLRLGRLQVDNRGVAITGADPQRPGLLDARSGRPAATDVLAAVAIADSTADAAAMSSALFVAGSKDGADMLSKTRRLEAIMLVEGNGTRYVLASATLQGRLELSAELEQETGGQVRYLLPPRDLEGSGLPFGP